MIKYMSVILMVGTLFGCNSTSKNSTVSLECNNDNWIELGHKAAIEGKKVRSFDDYINQCGDKLNKKAKEYYVAGYSKGLKTYCTYDEGYKNGFDKGLARSEPSNICPLESRTEFNRGHTQGQVAYKLQREYLKELERGQEAAKGQGNIMKAIDTKPKGHDL